MEIYIKPHEMSTLPDEADSVPSVEILLAELQHQTGLNDTKLATYIGVDRTTVVKFKAHLEDLPIHAKVAIYDHLGYFKALSWFRLILPNKAGEKLEAWSQRHAAWLAEKPEQAAKVEIARKQAKKWRLRRSQFEHHPLQDAGAVASGGLQNDAHIDLLKDWFQLVLDLKSQGLTPDQVKMALVQNTAAPKPTPTIEMNTLGPLTESNP